LGVRRGANDPTPYNKSTIKKPEGKTNQADLPEQTRKRKKNNDMVIGKWNVLCLNQAGSLKHPEDEVKHKTALQEIRWQGGGITDT
jgi:hypothetical protein